MTISDIISPERISCNVEVTSKKAVLELLSDLLATSQVTLTSNAVFESLIARERLGSTGIGHGVAIPHGRLDKIQSCVGAFLHLKESIAFDAIDNEPVDLFFALLVPEESTETHLQLLAKLAEQFANKDFCNKLRLTNNQEALYNLFADT